MPPEKNRYTLAPLRLFGMRQKLLQQTKPANPLIFSIRCALVFPFIAIAAIGHALALLILPTMIARLGLMFSSDNPSVVWVIFVEIVIALYGMMWLSSLNQMLKSLRARVIDIEVIISQLMITFGFLLLAFFIHDAFHAQVLLGKS